ncbi:MAG: YigZ family protein [Desulfovibrio sp.]|nr:YigZ family protein [Desulfovibrio sp.]
MAEGRTPGANKGAASYPVPTASPRDGHRTEILVRRSRFLASCARTPDAASARNFVESVRYRCSDATHNCWAYAAGPPGDTARIGASDDGEPRGTAGRPMLNVLLHSGIGEICVVVSRWFGGVKLGTGGLVRAYQDAVRENLATLALAERVPSARYSVSLGYAYLDGFHRLLPRFGATVIAWEHLEEAGLLLELPEARRATFENALAELTNGTAAFRAL